MLVGVRAMPWALAVALAGCLQISTGTDGGSGGSSSAVTSAGDDAAGAASTCSQDAQTGVVLCAQTSACPEVSVDPSLYPACGFRSGAPSTLDLECLCNGGFLCPIGAATTCAQATQLLMAQDALLVCQQVSENRCIQLMAPDSGGAVPTSCDTNCIAGCGAAPDCQQVCGCQ